jgi:hypothetical protein
MNNLLRLRVALFAAVLLVAASGAWAQAFVSNIGYVYPAGGRQGDSFEVTVGGQFLKGVTDVYFSGKGVDAEIVKYIKPLSKKQINDLRKKFNMLQKTLPASARRKPYRLRFVSLAPKFNAYAKEMGLKDMDLKTYFELMKKLRDPKRQPNAQLAEQVILRIKISPDADPSPREMRFKTNIGLSNPRMFQIAEFKEYRETEPNNKTADSAITGSLPAVINGQIMPGDVDRFEFTARKGTRLVASADARELIPYLADAVPGWFQATLALYNENGERVAYADDYRFHPDPVLRYLVPETGKYVLEIKDAIYRGREDFVYRITLGSTPFVTSIFPLGGPAGGKTLVQAQGWNLPTERMKLNNTDRNPGVRSISIGRGRRASNRVPFALDTLAECRDIEPNNSPSSPQKVKLPTIVNGRINRSGDWDVFSFTGRKGDEVVARVQARSLGSPMDSMLKLTDAAGKTLAVNDDYEDKGAGLITHHADSMLSVKLPADGTYLLHLGDTQSKGGPDCGYRLRIGPCRPDFALRVTPSGISARPGAVVPITVYALRKDGFTDSITLKLTDAPSGFSLSGARIPAGQDKLTLTITLPFRAPSEPVMLNLVGQSVIDGKAVTRQAQPAEDMMQAFLYRHLVTAENWMAIVSKKGRWSPPWRILRPGPTRLTPGKTSLVRLTGFRGPMASKLQLELSAPPAGVSIGKVTPGARGAMTFELKADPAKAKTGARGNLIVNAFVMRAPRSRDGKKRPPRRMSMGVLPAIPFEILPAASDKSQR